MAIVGQQSGAFGMAGFNQPYAGMGSLQVTPAAPNLPYRPDANKYISDFRVNSLGNLVGQYQGKPTELNGVRLDLKAINAYEGTTPTVNKLSVNNEGKLFGNVTYQIANPNYGKWVTRQSPYGNGFWGGGWGGIDENKTVATTKEVELQGFQLDMANISKSRKGNLPSENNIYLRMDEGGLIGDIQAIWEGSKTFTAATGRQMIQQEQAPLGDRLSRRSSARTQTTLGSSPTSEAAGTVRSDPIALRQQKGTILT
jgi:hypothetical protein